MKGLITFIYRHKSRKCPINVFDDKQELTLIDAEIARVFESDEERPAIRLVRRNLLDAKGEMIEYIHAEPMKKGFYAFGGSYVFSSDSRVRAIAKYPIPLHDRDMSRE